MNEVMVLDNFVIPEYAKDTSTGNDFGKPGGLPKIALFKAPAKFLDKDGIEKYAPGQFKIMKGEQEQTIQAPIPVIIMGITPTGTSMNRAYYAGDYVPGTNRSPDCASSDGIIPDSGDLRQSVTCAACPHSQWGSKGKGQACSQGKTMYVVPKNDPAGELFQVRVPPTSLKNVGIYGSRLATSGVSSATVITNLDIIETADGDYPVLALSPAGFLEYEIGSAVMARAQSLEIRSLIVDRSTTALPDPLQAPQQAAPQQVTPQQAAPQQDDVSGLGPDAAGVFWDGNLHSSGQTKIKDGTWKRRKGGPKVADASTQQAAPQQVASQQAAPQQALVGGGPIDEVLDRWQ